MKNLPEDKSSLEFEPVFIYTCIGVQTCLIVLLLNDNQILNGLFISLFISGCLVPITVVIRLLFITYRTKSEKDLDFFAELKIAYLFSLGGVIVYPLVLLKVDNLFYSMLISILIAPLGMILDKFHSKFFEKITYKNIPIYFNPEKSSKRVRYYKHIPISSLFCYSCRDIYEETEKVCDKCGAPRPACVICRAILTPKNDPRETIIITPCCEVYVHKVHLEEWLKHKSVCPNCKKSLKMDEKNISEYLKDIKWY